jgi:hypothetical protein
MTASAIEACEGVVLVESLAAAFVGSSVSELGTGGGGGSCWLCCARADWFKLAHTVAHKNDNHRTLYLMLRFPSLRLSAGFLLGYYGTTTMSPGSNSTSPESGLLDSAFL